MNPQPSTATSSPSQVPRAVLPTGPAIAPPVDACINFNMPDGRVVCLSVPPSITSDADIAFVLAVIQGYLSALVRSRT